MPLKPDQDAFGEALRDHLGGGPTSVVVERDDGFVEPHGTEVYFFGPEEWAPHKRQAVEGARGTSSLSTSKLVEVSGPAYGGLGIGLIQKHESRFCAWTSSFEEVYD